MKNIYVGMDVSKGYVDIAAVNDAGSVLPYQNTFDDTIKGHLEFQRSVETIEAKHFPAHIIFGLECSGGLERNWLHLIRRTFPGRKVYSLNPLAIKKFAERCLHRNVTDRKSAMDIANFLRQGLRPQDKTYEPQLDGPKTLYRHIRNEISRIASWTNELQSLLVRAHPELVQYCRSGINRWVMMILDRYNTADELRYAKPEDLSSIPYVTEERAERIIKEAGQSVASQTDAMTKLTIQTISRDILQKQKQVEELKEELIRYIGDDETIKLWCSFPGIGLWTATCLRLEFGGMERFYSSKAAVAFTGLDPIVQKSGDTEKNKGMSRQGRRQIRGILYPAILSAIRCNPVIHDFYAKLRGNGKIHKQAMVACMRKTVGILYAMAVRGCSFDAEYHSQLCREWELKKARKEAEKSSPIITKENDSANEEDVSLSAPITRREAKRRKERMSKSRGAGSSPCLTCDIKTGEVMELSHTGTSLSMRDLATTSR